MNQDKTKSEQSVSFSVDTLRDKLFSCSPNIVFAFLHGSAKNGVVAPDSDIDIALFLSKEADLALLGTVSSAVQEVVPQRECDIGILNRAEPIYRFEALNGQLLFTRDEESYLRFFSLTCREYEDQLADYERQRRYRLEYHHGI